MSFQSDFNGTLLIRKRTPVGTYSRPMPRVPFCYMRGTGPGRLRKGDLPEYNGTSLTRKRTPLGPYRRTEPRALWGSKGVGRFLVSEVPRDVGSIQNLKDPQKLTLQELASATSKTAENVLQG